MLKVYKSGLVELSDESFTVDAHKAEFPDFLSPAEEEDEEGSAQAALAGEEMALLLRKAEERAEQLLQDARDRAAVMAEEILQSARQQAAEEAEQLRKRTYDDAYNHGITDGIQAKTRQVESVIAKLEEAVVRIEGELSGFIAQYEGDLRWAVLEVASKVLHKTVERDDMEMLEMVKAAVDTVKNAEWINVHLSDEAVYLIDRLEREMAPMKYLTIIPEELPPGSCIVDIPSGRIDASIHTQLSNLKEYFTAHSGDF
ncbi:MAG: FliH/SctL family protein [Angelakisella sp.]